MPFFVLMFPASVLLALGVSRLEQQRRKPVSPGVGKERELLSAIRDNAGSITAAEAAMEPSLTVVEADEMPSEPAGGGHLLVESSGDTLYYKLPGLWAGSRWAPSRGPPRRQTWDRMMGVQRITASHNTIL